MTDLTPTTADIRYAPSLQCRLDYFANATVQNGGNAAWVFAHGGGWNGTDRTAMRLTDANGHSPCEYALLSGLTVNKWNVFSIDFRQAAQTGVNKNSYPSYFPEQYEDCSRAIQFLRDHASTYNLNPQKIVFAGYSAGSTMALYAAFRRSMPYFSGTRFIPTARFAYRSSSIPNAVLNALGVIDVRFDEALGVETFPGTGVSALPALFGTSTADGGTEWGAVDRNLKAAASPLAYVEEAPLEAQAPVYSAYYNTGTLTKPFVSLHPSQQAATLHTALTTAGVPNAFEIIANGPPGGGGGGGDWDDSVLGPQINARVFGFIEAHI